MNKVCLLAVLFVFAGCQPDVQQSPAAPTAADAKPAAQEETMRLPAEPAPQQEQAALVAAPVVAQPVQRMPEAVKPAVVSPTQGVEVPMAGPEKTEQLVVKEPAAVTQPAPPGRLSEEAALALARKKNCLACHALDKKMVGPAWRAVAQKYRGQAGAQAAVEVKVRKGGKGDWGTIAMPPQPALSDEELTGLVQFVLQLQ